MKKIYKVGATMCLLAIAVFTFNGCAAIFQGTHEDVHFDAGPGSAEVYVNGAEVGTTPCQVELKRNQDYTIEFRKKGYETKTYRITNSVGAGWVVLDVIGGLIPVVIDAATGAWSSLDQSNINAVLAKEQ